MKPVEGRNIVEIDNERWIDIRINAMPSVFGQDLAIRLFGRSDDLVQIDGLGYFPAEIDAVKELLDFPGGLILVSGPTGSGKTNSLYAFLKYLNRGDRKIHTLEEPVEYLVPGVVQSQINLRAGIDFSTLLTAVLRHAPDVIMIGEVRDARTAEVAVRAGGSGQLVLATVHAQTGVGAIQSMRAYGVNSHFLAGSLVGVVGQRLIRRLCAKCSTSMNVADYPHFHSSIRHLAPSNYRPSFFYPGSCESCMDGYDQLTCIPEIIKIDAKLRRAIADELSTDRLQEIAIANGTVPLAVTAQLRAALGVTTVEEIIRVLPDYETETKVLSFQQDAGSSRLDHFGTVAKSPARHLQNDGENNGDLLEEEITVNSMN
jgi:type II secretory ATPase GspE/PulE/Tfp pilus assembly ATPase PilB-like protein